MAATADPPQDHATTVPVRIASTGHSVEVPGYEIIEELILVPTIFVGTHGGDALRRGTHPLATM